MHTWIQTEVMRLFTTKGNVFSVPRQLVGTEAVLTLISVAVKSLKLHTVS